MFYIAINSIDMDRHAHVVAPWPCFPLCRFVGLPCKNTQSIGSASASTMPHALLMDQLEAYSINGIHQSSPTSCILVGAAVRNGRAREWRCFWQSMRGGSEFGIGNAVDCCRLCGRYKHSNPSTTVPYPLRSKYCMDLCTN